MDTLTMTKNNAQQRARLRKNLIHNIILWMLRIGLGFIFVFPLLWALSTSITPSDQLISDKIRMFATKPTWEFYHFVFTYRNVFRANAFFVALINTTLLTALGMVLNLVLCTAAAYAFAKLRFKGHAVIFKVFLSSMMIPGIVTLVPTFVIIRMLRLWGSILGVVIPGAISVFNIFFMRQFFLQLPDELGESASIDGASQLMIFLKIYVPLVKPALATLAIFSFQGGWNNFLMPYVILPDNQLVLSTFIRTFQADSYGKSMAASMVATLPVLVLFIFFQKYFMNSIAFSGMKE